jgi:DNA repair photolyase
MENVTWNEEGILASDVWAIPKSLEPMSAEEERAAWRKTVKVLDNLCGLSDTLMLDPLILALTDALMRSKEELARAEDRLARPQGAELHPCEHERLKSLLRRADTLGYVHTALCGEEWDNAEFKEEVLEIVENMRKEATEHFERYRFEVGIPDPTA